MAKRSRTPRALWTGSISFGLVNVPVRVFTAVHEHKLSLPPRARGRRRADRLPEDLQARRQARLERRDRQGVRGREGRVRPPDGRGLRGRPGRGAAHDRPRGFRALRRDRPDVLRAHLSRRSAGGRRAAVRAARPRDGGFGARGDRQVRAARAPVPRLPPRAQRDAHARADVLRRRGRQPPETILPAKLPNVAKRELELGISLIQGFAGDWQPDRYHDTYREALLAIIEEKRAGREVHRAPEPEEESPPDLMEALRRSLEQVESGRAGRPNRDGNGSTKAKSPTKSELEERARELDIPGRSSMSKDELAEAVASAE